MHAGFLVLTVLSGVLCPKPFTTRLLTTQASTSGPPPLRRSCLIICGPCRQPGTILFKPKKQQKIHHISDKREASRFSPRRQHQIVGFESQAFKGKLPVTVLEAITSKQKPSSVQRPVSTQGVYSRVQPFQPHLLPWHPSLSLHKGTVCSTRGLLFTAQGLRLPE